MSRKELKEPKISEKSIIKGTEILPLDMANIGSRHLSKDSIDDMATIRG